MTLHTLAIVVVLACLFLAPLVSAADAKTTEDPGDFRTSRCS